MPLQQIQHFLNHGAKKQPSMVLWLVEQAIKYKASDLHIDWVNGCYTCSLRIAGQLQYVTNLSLKEGYELLHTIKKELHLDAKSLRTPWSGRLTGNQDNHAQYHQIHIIPFHPLESVIIRLQPQKPAKPTWTSSPAITKKIFIWQMGKVGSSTILASLKPYTKRYNWQFHARISNEPFWQYNNIIHSHSAKPIYHTLHHSDEDFIVISLVRDLLQRNISAVFQSMCDESPGNHYFIAPERKLKTWSYEQIQEEIIRKLLHLNLSNQLTDWYDVLFKSHFYYPDVDRYHIDIYSTPFDRKKGMQVYESKTPRIKMLIIRLENLNKLEKEIGRFLGIQNFELCNNNIAAHKWYKKLYQKFKKTYEPTQQELDHIYNSKFMNYFYGSDYKIPM